MSVKKMVATIATAGLTMCNGGAVDPAPQPLQCSSVGDGGTLSATGTVSGTTLNITVNAVEFNWAGAPTLSNVVNAGILTVTASGGTATVVLNRSSAGGDGGLDTTGSFTLTGMLTDGTTTCPVTRTFTFTITGTTVAVAELDLELPLRRREPATIEVVPSHSGRAERDVLVRASARATDTLTWTVTGGSLAHEQGVVRWTLPTEPGLYQIEVLVDRGHDGVALDTLVMEVV